jgi:2-polyprenyl-3-methyl-5-hydroxy-6-metoxy-1,4-benzoquinol methylase
VASHILFDVVHKCAAEILRYVTEESTDKCRRLCYETTRCNGATVKDTVNQTRLPTLHTSANGMYVSEYVPSDLHTFYVKLYRITKHVLPYFDTQIYLHQPRRQCTMHLSYKTLSKRLFFFNKIQKQKGSEYVVTVLRVTAETLY